MATLGEYPFEDVDRCVALAKRDIDDGTFDEIAEGVYRGLSAYQGNMEAFVEAIQPYYEERNQ